MSKRKNGVILIDKRKGFTLIELLVVISIIALLMAVLVPALRAAKEAAYGANCLNNQHSLAMAWFTYTIDNDGKLVSGDILDETTNPNFSRTYSGKDWVDPPITVAGDYAATSTNCTIVDEKRGIERGTLFPYTKDVKVYHCPGDKRYKKPPTDPQSISKKQDGGYRTYSIPDCLNGDIKRDDKWKKCNIELYAQIKSPAEKYVFIEENDSRGFNRCSWSVDLVDDPSHWVWHDNLASWHNEKSTLGWADGHSNMHRWVDKRTVVMAKMDKRSDFETYKKTIVKNNADLEFMCRHYPHIGKMK